MKTFRGGNKNINIFKYSKSLSSFSRTFQGNIIPQGI